MLALSDRDCYRREELLDQIHECPPLKDNGLWKQGDLANAQRGNTLTPHFSLGKDAPAISPDFRIWPAEASCPTSTVTSRYLSNLHFWLPS